MTLAEKVKPDGTALLGIDMQKDYCCRGGSFDRRGFDTEPSRLLGPKLNLFLDELRKVPISIVHIKMTKIRELSSEANAEHYSRLGIKRGYDPTYSEFFEIVPRENDVVIPKYSYSAFFSTYLEQYLKSNGIRTLILTGVATNVCVEAAARDAFIRDYHVVVVRDLTEGSSPDAKEASLKNIDLFFGEVAGSQALLGCWETGSESAFHTERR